MSIKNDIHAQREQMIAKYGWMVQGVFSDGKNPGFCYTIGLHSRGMPELLVFALPQNVAHMLLSEIIGYMLEYKEAHGDWPTGRTSLENWPLPFILQKLTCADVKNHAYGAVERSSGAAEFMQIHLPDAKGLFNWEAGCDPKMLKASPVLRNDPSLRSYTN